MNTLGKFKEQQWQQQHLLQNETKRKMSSSEGTEHAAHMLVATSTGHMAICPFHALPRIRPPNSTKSLGPALTLSQK